MTQGELRKDIVLLCLTNAGISIINFWTVLYPYYASYLYDHNSNITASKVFSGLILYYLGNVFGNAIDPYLIRIIGYKNMLFYAGILSIYVGYVMIARFTLIEMFIGRFLVGIIKAMVWDSNNLFLSEKYANSGGILYAKYLHMFRQMISSVFIFFSQMMINPFSLNAISVGDDKIFPQEVNSNFERYMYIQTTIFFFCLVIPPVFLRVPFRLESQIFPWIKSHFKKSQFQHSMTKDEIKILMSTSRASINLNMDISKSFHGLIDNQKTFIFEEENTNPQHLLFYVLFFVILDNTMATFVGDNYKYVCILMNFEDAEIAFFYFLSPFILMTCNFIAASLYSRFGLQVSFHFNTFMNTINWILVFLSIGYKPAFLLTVFFSRFYTNYSMCLNDIISFSLFQPQTGILYVKYFTCAYFVSALLAIFINSYIIDPKNIYPIFYLFAAINLLNYLMSSFVFSKYKFHNQFLQHLNGFLQK